MITEASISVEKHNHIRKQLSQPFGYKVASRPFALNRPTAQFSLSSQPKHPPPLPPWPPRLRSSFTLCTATSPSVSASLRPPRHPTDLRYLAQWLRPRRLALSLLVAPPLSTSMPSTISSTPISLLTSSAPRLAETLPQEILTKMHAPGKPDYPIISAEQLPEFDA